MTDTITEPAGFLITAVTAPPGTYYLGDPCYAVPDDDWDPLLQSCGTFFRSPVGEMRDGTQVLGFGTDHGDGAYPDNHGNTFGVDAGMIGLVPVTPATRAKVESYGGPRSSLVVEVTFGDAVLCYTNDGVLVFGDYVVNTNYPDPSDYDESDDDEDGEDD